MTILLLHGALGAKSQLEQIKSSLQGNGHTVCSMNFSGHGGAPFSPMKFGIEAFAQDVKDFIQSNQLQHVHIFGYSMGGYVALWFAHLYPENVESVITLGTKYDWDIVSAEREVRKVNPDKIAEKIPAFARILESRHAPNDWKELLHKTGAMMQQLGARPLITTEILTGINIPVSVVLGDQDDMADRDYSIQVSKLLPNGKFLSLENTPHPIEKVKWIPFSDDSLN